MNVKPASPRVTERITRDHLDVLQNIEFALADCYRNCFKAARETGVETIAFPSISTGAYRFPLEAASQVALETTVEFLRANERPDPVRFVLFDDSTCSVFVQAAEQLQDA